MLLKKELTKEVLDWIKSFVIIIAGFWLFFTFIAAPFMVNGSSMRPTLQNKERLLVNKFIYHFQEPQKGDIIVFEYPSDRSRNFVKRVIATSGDTIEITDSMVFVNGKLIKEDYILAPSYIDFKKQTVPEGTVFVMGDNRNNSRDSRFSDVRFVPFSNIAGKVSMVFKHF